MKQKLQSLASRKTVFAVWTAHASLSAATPNAPKPLPLSNIQLQRMMLRLQTLLHLGHGRKSCTKYDLRFARRWVRRWLSSKMWRRAGWYKLPPFQRSVLPPLLGWATTHKTTTTSPLHFETTGYRNNDETSAHGGASKQRAGPAKKR
jgi:hypothetical protein